jgi:hypothetical protein
MNPKDAITAHVNWKLRIHALLSGKSTEKFDPSVIERDNVCELGKWIHSEARSQLPQPLHAELIATHADFHREAARIVRAVTSGRTIGIEAIDMNAPFGKLTTKIVGMLTKVSGS